MKNTLAGIVALLAISLTTSTVSAQSSADDWKTIQTEHVVEVQQLYVEGPIGDTFWGEVLRTDDFVEAIVMRDLLEWALESGQIHEILGLGRFTIAIDVRIRSEYKRNVNLADLAVKNKFQPPSVLRLGLPSQSRLQASGKTK